MRAVLLLLLKRYVEVMVPNSECHLDHLEFFIHYLDKEAKLFAKKSLYPLQERRVSNYEQFGAVHLEFGIARCCCTP